MAGWLLFLGSTVLGVWWLYRRGLWWRLGLEWLAVVLGASMVAGRFLNLNPQVIPAGGEFLSNIHYFHFWRWLRTCGLCAFWAPFNGGFPALADPFPPLLHPLVAVPVLIFGVVNGAKVALFLAFLSAGLAQWWMGYLWRLHPLARVWGAWMLMASGYLSGRLALGAMHMVIGLATAAWLFPAFWWLWQRTGRKAFLPLAWALGLLILAERGYTLAAFLFTWGILLAWLALFHRLEAPVAFWRKIGGGVLGALLLAAPSWLPFLRTMGAAVKDVDPEFKVSQSLANLLVNFVAATADFYRSPVLEKLPYPELTAFFVGWIPLLLAVAAVVAAWTDAERRAKRFPVTLLAVWAFLLLWTATGQPFRWLIHQVPFRAFQDLLAGLRHIQQVAALAIPLILMLAMVSADDLIRWAAGWNLQFVSRERSLSIPVTLGIAVLLFFPLRTGWTLGQDWMTFRDYPQLDAGLNFLAEAGLTWVDTPFGEHFWVEPAVSHDLKVLFQANSIRRWRWKDWTLPEPARVLVRDPAATISPGDAVVPLEGGVYGVTHQTAYAFVQLHDATLAPCDASGWGGVLNVRCRPAREGSFWVMEHAWPGWWVQVDGGGWRRLDAREPYLGTKLEAGDHTVRLRFIPEDSLLGLLAALGWLIWQVRLGWRRFSRNRLDV